MTSLRSTNEESADVRGWFAHPNDYRRVIETQKRFKAQGLSDEEAIMAAFEENAHDLARVGGK